LGAIQNRLQFTTGNLGNAIENLTAAESAIRDADVAEEISQFTRNQILTQAATSMITQANALPQSALSLLQ
jgi:flagellin